MMKLPVGSISIHAVLMFFFMVCFAFAAEDPFTVSTVVSGDGTPPSIPTNLSATTISGTQVDLSWDPSTDNFVFGGYQVFRNGSQIATTTLTSYSDTVDTSTTTYAYLIKAFDAALNISASSSVASSTVFVVVATSTPTTTPESRGGSTPIVPTPTEIIRYETTAGSTYVDVLIETNVPTRLNARWGRTGLYELGYSVQELFTTTHTFRITNLSPGTLHELELELARKLLPEEDIVLRRQVWTDTLGDAEAPTNVSNLEARIVDGQVELSWDNPDDADFSYVRILGNSLFYPVHQYDGWFVFEGDGERAVDRRAPEDGERYYYTVFAYDEYGNRSSGAVVSVSLPVYGAQEESATSTGALYEESAGEGLTLEDIQFIQDDKDATYRKGAVELRGDRVTTISIPYDALPEHLKTIVVTLTRRSDGGSFSFLLSVNNDKTFYEAKIGALQERGIYDITIEFFDYATKKITTLNGVLNVFVQSEVPERQERQNSIKTLLMFVFVPSMFFLIFLWVLLLYTRDKDEDNHKEEEA